MSCANFIHSWHSSCSARGMSDYPDIRQMRAFLSVAETNSFTKAAKLMNLTQSAISPRCEVVVSTGDSSSLIEMLDNAEIEYAFGMCSKHSSWCHYEQLFSDHMGFVMSGAHPWASMSDVPATKLQDDSFLVYGRSSETFRLIREQVEKMGVKLRISMNLDDMEAIKEMAKIGLGVGIVAPWVAKRELDSGELKFVKCSGIDIKRDWGVYYHDLKKKTLPEATFLGIARLVCASSES